MITALTNASCVSPRILARVLAIEVSLIFGIDIHLCRFRFYVSSVFNPLDPNFHSLEVVDRVSETQLQVGENSN